MSNRFWKALGLGSWLLVVSACADDGGGAQSCDERCQDETAARALRETLKLIYNLTLQGKPVGEQDETTRCPLGGSARVYGTATSVAEQGTTEVDLIYELTTCAYVQRDDEPEESYDTVIGGVFKQTGIIAVQPSANAALIIESESFGLEGTVYDPPVRYAQYQCSALLQQDGNAIAGTWCGREIALQLSAPPRRPLRDPAPEQLSHAGATELRRSRIPTQPFTSLKRRDHLVRERPPNR